MAPEVSESSSAARSSLAIASALAAVVRLLGERAPEHAVTRRPRPSRRAAAAARAPLRGTPRYGAAAEGRAPREHLEEDRADREQVAAPVDASPSTCSGAM